jgi:hypothetical protein
MTFVVLGSLAAAAVLVVAFLAARAGARAAAATAKLERREAEYRALEEKLREVSELARKQEEQLEHSTRLAEVGEMVEFTKGLAAFRSGDHLLVGPPGRAGRAGGEPCRR